MNRFVTFVAFALLLVFNHSFGNAEENDKIHENEETRDLDQIESVPLPNVTLSGGPVFDTVIQDGVHFKLTCTFTSVDFYAWNPSIAFYLNSTLLGLYQTTSYNHIAAWKPKNQLIGVNAFRSPRHYNGRGSSYSIWIQPVDGFKASGDYACSVTIENKVLNSKALYYSNVLQLSVHRFCSQTIIGNCMFRG